MTPQIKIAISLSVIWFSWVNAQVLDSIGNYQLNATYLCAIEFTEAEHKAQCRGELDGFGHLRVLLPAGADFANDYVAFQSELHK